MPARRVDGAGTLFLPASPDAVRRILFDPAALARIVPGAEKVERLAEGRFRAVLRLGVGRLAGRYAVLLDIGEAGPGKVTLTGRSSGPLGHGEAAAQVTLAARPRGTRIAWSFVGQVGGLVTLAGQPALGLASRLFIQRFFVGLRRSMTIPAGAW
jgi:carbon monoxide dehydrogenase subunit G